MVPILHGGLTQMAGRFAGCERVSQTYVARIQRKMKERQRRARACVGSKIDTLRRLPPEPEPTSRWRS